MYRKEFFITSIFEFGVSAKTALSLLSVYQFISLSVYDYRVYKDKVVKEFDRLREPIIEWK